jgi:hypothetical protein
VSLRTWMAAAVVLGLGCGGKKDEKTETKAETKSETKADPKVTEGKPKTETKPAAGKGLDNPANNAEFVKLAKAVLTTCGDKWKLKEGFDDCNEPMKALRDAKLEKLDATCLNVLEAEDIKVRYLGAVCMSNFGSDYRSDKAIANRLVDALEREKAPSPIDMHLAYLATGIYDGAGPEVVERLAKLFADPKTSSDVRLLLASWWSKPKAYDTVKALATDADARMRLGAVQGYAVHFKGHEDEACGVWEANLDHADGEVSKQAYGHLTGGWSGNNARDTEGNWYVTGGGGGPSSMGDNWCKNVDVALTKIEAKIKDSKIDDSVYVYALGNLAKHEKATPAQKKKAIALLEKMIATKGIGERSFAVRKLVEADKTKKASLKKYAADPDLKYTIESIMKEP